MDYSEVKKELKKEFESFLKPMGFKSKTDNQGCKFKLENKNCQYNIGYGVSNYVDEFYTGCYIAVELFEIEKIRAYLFDEGGYGIGSNIGAYFNELNYRYKIKTQEDIKEWGKIVRKFYKEYVVPFFEKYNSLDAIDKLLNENPSEKAKFLDDLGWRIIKGLIAAKLNQNPKYNELREYYRGEVENKFQGYFMYDKCMKVIDFLESHSTEELKKKTESSN